MAHNILLESGTNEMELLTFSISDTSFGVNVAKVREIIQKPDITVMPSTHLTVEGTFLLRDKVLSLVDLGQFFDFIDRPEGSPQAGLVIIVEFNAILCGILVDKVNVIQRLSWDLINAPSEYLLNMDIPVTGTVILDGVTVQVIDLETILANILGAPNPVLEERIAPKCTDFKTKKILLADDSTIVRQQLASYLGKCGFEYLTICSDGQQAWETLKKDDAEEYDLLISDIEMPSMDGLCLTNWVKSDPKLQKLPVLLLSSLISSDNVKKGEAVGANAQLRKSDMTELLPTIERLLTTEQPVPVLVAKQEASAPI